MTRYGFQDIDKIRLGRGSQRPTFFVRNEINIRLSSDKNFQISNKISIKSSPNSGQKVSTIRDTDPIMKGDLISIILEISKWSLLLQSNYMDNSQVKPPVTRLKKKFDGKTEAVQKNSYSTIDKA